MLVNLTPHPIRLFGPIAGPLDEPERVIEASGTIARVATADIGSSSRDGDTFTLVEYGYVHDLPPRQLDTLYIVSLVVALAARKRDDLVAPYKEVRNSEGTMIGCRFLQKVC